MSHLFTDYELAVPSLDWLHRGLRTAVPTIKRWSDGMKEPYTNDGLPDTLPHDQHFDSAFSFPFLDPRYCDRLVAELDGLPWKVNEDEAAPYQIPELVLAEHSEHMHLCMLAYKRQILDPITRLVWGRETSEVNSIQLAKYTPESTAGGNYHVDIDSDLTFIVGLNDPTAYQGGGTEFLLPAGRVCVRPRPQGWATCFPGKLVPHRGRKITSGARRLLVFWLNW